MKEGVTPTTQKQVWCERAWSTFHAAQRTHRGRFWCKLWVRASNVATNLFSCLFKSAQDGDPWPPCGAAVIRQGARHNQEWAEPEPERAAERDGPALQQSDEHAASTWQSPVSTKAAINPLLPVPPSVAALSFNGRLSSRPQGWSGSSSCSIIGSCRIHLTSCKQRPSLRRIRPNSSCRTGSRRSMTWKLSSWSVDLQSHLQLFVYWNVDCDVFYMYIYNCTV